MLLLNQEFNAQIQVFFFYRTLSKLEKNKIMRTFKKHFFFIFSVPLLQKKKKVSKYFQFAKLNYFAVKGI